MSTGFDAEQVLPPASTASSGAADRVPEPGTGVGAGRSSDATLSDLLVMRSSHERQLLEVLSRILPV